jgi:two-component system, OmpR family, response regulator VanR
MSMQRPVVLVVEDNKDIRDLLALFLLENGCDILEASNGIQAVQVAQEAHPDLVLMDFRSVVKVASPNPSTLPY